MKKSGFSLIELLMVIGIIGVVSTMGVSIAQNGMKNAYNQFWYEGYKTLVDITFDARMNNKGGTFSDYETHFLSLIKSVETSRYIIYPGNKHRTKVTTPNGIIFELIEWIPGTMEIQMYVPEYKKKSYDMSNYVTFFYEFTSGRLWPENSGGYSWRIDLQERADLLPFIIHDGYPSKSGNHNKKIYSFREAYCAVNSNVSYNPMTSGYAEIRCRPAVTPVTGIMMPVNPRKVF